MKVTIPRRIVQTLSLLIFALPLLICGWNLFGLNNNAYVDEKVLTPATQFFYGSLSSSNVFGLNILDPLATIEVIVASKSVGDWALAGLLPLIFYALIRGRAFCGWVCPVNFLLEGINWIKHKFIDKMHEGKELSRDCKGETSSDLKITKNLKLHPYIKMIVCLCIIVLSAILSIPIFELFSPIGAINKLLVFGSCTGLVVLVAIVLIELFYKERIWCRYLCPLGGFYEAIGRVGILNVHIDHTRCVKCNKCKSVCLCAPEILDAPISEKTKAVVSGDCMVCGKCIDACPERALKFKAGRGSN